MWRGRTRGGRSLRPGRPTARTWSARHSRCRRPAASTARLPPAPAAVRGGDRMRRAREDDALGVEIGDALGIGVERHDLAIDPRLAHPPRDQLRHLRSEIENENAVGQRALSDILHAKMSVSRSRHPYATSGAPLIHAHGEDLAAELVVEPAIIVVAEGPEHERFLPADLPMVRDRGDQRAAEALALHGRGGNGRC